MVVKMTKNMIVGRRRASRLRMKGFKVSLFKTKGGDTRLSVTRGLR